MKRKELNEGGWEVGTGERSRIREENLKSQEQSLTLLHGIEQY